MPQALVSSIGYLEQDKNLEDAISAYALAIRLKPGFSEAYNNQGNAKHVLGRHEDAIADYNKAILVQSEDAEVYSNRGAAKSELGLKDGVRADFKTAL